MPVLRWCGWPVRAGRQARGRADPAFVGTGVLVMAAARPWRRVAEGRDRYLVGFGELKGVLQGAPGSFRAAEHLERDHAQQERRCDPDPSGPQAVEERGGRGRRRMAGLGRRPPRAYAADLSACALAAGSRRLLAVRVCCGRAVTDHRCHVIASSAYGVLLDRFRAEGYSRSPPPSGKANRVRS